MKLFKLNRLSFHGEFILYEGMFLDTKIYYADIIKYGIKKRRTYNGVTKYLIINTTEKKYKFQVSFKVLNTYLLDETSEYIAIIKKKCPNAKYIKDKSILTKLVK